MKIRQSKTSFALAHSQLRTKPNVHGRRKRRQGGASLDFEIFSKKDCFFSFKWEKANLTTFGPPGKILKKCSTGPPGKNTSDAHAYIYLHKPAYITNHTVC